MKACRNCSIVANDDAKFCTGCGTSFELPPPPPPGAIPTYGYTSSINVQSATDDKSSMAVASVVCGILSFLFVPVVLGPLGIVFGAISWKAGNKTGLAGMVISIIGLPVGMLLGIISVS